MAVIVYYFVREIKNSFKGSFSTISLKNHLIAVSSKNAGKSAREE